MNRHFVTCKIAVAASAALLSSLASAADAQNTESRSGTSGRYAAGMEMDRTLAWLGCLFFCIVRIHW